MLEVRSPLSYEEFLSIREETRDKTELIDGVLYVTPAPARIHQLALLRTVRAFDSHFVRCGGGQLFFSPFDVRFAIATVVQPDMLVVLDDRAYILDEDPVVEAPSIAIEILSPSNSRYDLVIKRDLYALYGVPEYWIADPAAQTVTVMTNPVDGRYQSVVTSLDVATSVYVPEVSISIEDLFSPYYP
ncbi:MAG: Uma2 family endonuclease [Thermomicrobiales bacterium]